MNKKTSPKLNTQSRLAKVSRIMFIVFSLVGSTMGMVSFFHFFAQSTGVGLTLKDGSNIPLSRSQILDLMIGKELKDAQTEKPPVQSIAPDTEPPVR